MLKHRKRWPGFERRVQAARKAGSIRLTLQRERELAWNLEHGWPTDPALDALIIPKPSIKEMIDLARRAKAEETMRRRRAERDGRA